MGSSRNRDEKRLDQIRKKKLLQLQAQQEQKQQDELITELSDSDRLWNPTIEGLVDMNAAFHDESGQYNFSSQRFNQGYELAMKSYLMMKRFRPDDTTQLDAILDADLIPDWEKFNSALRENTPVQVMS